jgi:phospho-N-acetylmuramoyl-pentapeptide-transferase
VQPVRSVLVAALSALIVSLLCTPAVVRLFRRRGYGQEIREDGPSSHATKRGTPDHGRRGHHRRRRSSATAWRTCS